VGSSDSSPTGRGYDLLADDVRGRPRPLEQRIGIMQGRLVRAATGELESSPGERWRDEFRDAAALRLHHIELVADRLLDSANPMWSSEGRDEIADVAASTGVAVASLCLNEVLTSPIDDRSTDLAKRLGPVLRALHIPVVVVPLLEASDLNSVDQVSAARSILVLADLLDDDGRVVVELSLSAEDSLRFLDTTDSPRVGLCYDIGNATAFGFDPAHELRILGSAVWHLHAKDKNASKENVRFGTGRVPFAEVFEELSTQGFDGLVTMEATRGDDPFRTASQHRDFLLSMQPQKARSTGREYR
jgi:L-ribulose-5-phosphate 3-epimerase